MPTPKGSKRKIADTKKVAKTGSVDRKAVRFESAALNKPGSKSKGARKS